MWYHWPYAATEQWKYDPNWDVMLKDNIKDSVGEKNVKYLSNNVNIIHF